MSAKRCLIFLLAISSLATSGLASAYSSVVVYGDSLSDNGNLYNAILGRAFLSAVPEPSTLFLIVPGLSLLIAVRRRAA